MLQGTRPGRTGAVARALSDDKGIRFGDYRTKYIVSRSSDFNF